MSFPGAPFILSSKDREEFIKYWEHELTDSLVQTQEREQCLRECICLYLAEPPSKTKTFPWKGAANIVIPLIGITVDSIVARIVNTIFAVEPFWKISALTPDFAPHVRPAEDFLEWSRKTEFDWYKAVKTWVIEVVQCGTSWLKMPWEISNYATYAPNRSGGFDPYIIERRRPNPQHVLDVDIIRQCGILDEKQAEWMGHRFRLTDTQVYSRFYDGIWSTKTGGMVNDSNTTDVMEILDRKEELHIVDDIFSMSCCDSGGTIPRLNTFYELYAKMRIPGSRDKTIHDVVITYHHPTRKILRAIYNPIAWGERIFVKGRFIEVLARSKGLGIAKQLKYMQDEITTIHCQQLDNATIANTRFFLGKRGRIKDGTRVWPGRVLTTPDPDKDLKAIQMGDIYQSMRALEQSVLAFAERRSGVSDYSLGRESSVIGDRATATGTMAIIQEGNRRFDLNVRDLRDSLGDAGRLILQLNQQFRPEGTAFYVQGAEKGQFTEQLLDMPQEYIAHKLGVELSASTATINRQVEQQGLTALMGLLMQHMQAGQQAAMMLANPQAPAELKEFTTKAMQGVSEIVKRITQTNDMRDLDMLVPSLGPAAQASMALNGNVSGAMQLAGALGPVGGTSSPTSLPTPNGIPPGPESPGVQGNGRG